jgi:hypothetical protein
MPRVVSKEESRILLTRDGKWFHEGEPFENRKIIDFFHRAIRKDPDGAYYLYNVVEGKTEHVYFDVEDTAYFVQRVSWDAQTGILQCELNTKETIPIDPDTLEESGQGIMYGMTKEGDRARFTVKALEMLAEVSSMDDGGVYIQAGEKKIYLHRE